MPSQSMAVRRSVLRAQHLAGLGVDREVTLRVARIIADPINIRISDAGIDARNLMKRAVSESSAVRRNHVAVPGGINRILAGFGRAGRILGIDRVAGIARSSDHRAGCPVRTGMTVQ